MWTKYASTLFVHLLKIEVENIKTDRILQSRPPYYVSPSMSTLHIPNTQKRISQLWKMLSDLEFCSFSIEQAIKKLEGMDHSRNTANASQKKVGGRQKARQSSLIEETLRIPAAILTSTLQARKISTQQKLQTLLAKHGSTMGTHSYHRDTENTETAAENSECSDLFTRVKELLAVFDEHFLNVQDECRSSIVQSNVCNMICKNPTGLHFKNGKWKSCTGGVDSDDPNSVYVKALHQRLRRQCRNIVLLQRERNAILLQNDLLKENLDECQCSGKKSSAP